MQFYRADFAMVHNKIFLQWNVLSTQFYGLIVVWAKLSGFFSMAGYPISGGVKTQEQFQRDLCVVVAAGVVQTNNQIWHSDNNSNGNNNNSSSYNNNNNCSSFVGGVNGFSLKNFSLFDWDKQSDRSLSLSEARASREGMSKTKGDRGRKNSHYSGKFDKKLESIFLHK